MSTGSAFPAPAGGVRRSTATVGNTGEAAWGTWAARQLNQSRFTAIPFRYASRSRRLRLSSSRKGDRLRSERERRALELPVRFYSTPHVAARVEIGRASCRERV